MKRTGKNIICSQCDKEFYVPGWALKSSGSHGTPRKYCSKACQKVAFKGKHFSPSTEIEPGQNLGFEYRFEKGHTPANYKGGWITEAGYKMIGDVFEHRLVMERELGRKLEDYEIVHHIDGNKLNNEPSNLEVMTQSQHIYHHKLWEYSPRTKRGWNLA